MMLRITEITTSLYGMNWAVGKSLPSVRYELNYTNIVQIIILKSHNCTTIGVFLYLMRLMADQVPHSSLCFWVEINKDICAKYRLYFSSETSRIECM
jgi:hypothetical protein